MDVAQVRADLIAEQQALDDIVAALDDAQWAMATPSPHWTVADQIGHLTYFDATAAQAITDPDAFEASVSALLESLADEGGDDVVLRPYRAMSRSELLVAWRANRAGLAEAANRLSDDARVPWYGPSMGSKSFLTARLMETWAHGQDIVDTVGARRPPTERLRHIAQLGFITRGWSYANRGLAAPDVTIRVELASPAGATWVFGPDDAAETISGEAEEFCLVVTQRRHVDDTGLTLVGAAAREWMELAQAFAGGPTNGPEAGRFS